MKIAVIAYWWDDRSEPFVYMHDDRTSADARVKELRQRPDIGLIMIGEMTSAFERDYDRR